MSVRVLKIAATSALAACLWVVPSVGTRGQGTLGDRFVHVDRDLVANTEADRAALLRADAAIAGAVAGL